MLSLAILALHLDGWSNIRSEDIINFVVTTAEQKPFHIKCLETNENRHSSEYIATEIVKVMNQYNLNKCIGTINDNAANMKKATASHILHLIIMDLLKFPTMTSFVSKVKDIIKCIKHSQVLNPIFDGIRKAKKCPKNLVLPGTTHWGSHLFCLQSMSVCKESLQTLAVYEGLVLY